MSRLRAVLVGACLSVALGGCGNTRTPVPSVAPPVAPTGFRSLNYPAAGITLVAPRNWSVAQERSPLVSVIASGSAVVAVWRFARAAPPPADAAGLRQAATRLIAAAHARDAGIEVIRTRLRSFKGAPALELDAIERIGGEIRRVRSTHVFVRGAEFVLDEYAPIQAFHQIDHAVFSPVKRSLRLAGARAAG